MNSKVQTFIQTKLISVERVLLRRWNLKIYRLDLTYFVSLPAYIFVTFRHDFQISLSNCFQMPLASM